MTFYVSILLFLSFAVSSSFANELKLQIDTWPSHAEISIGSPPDSRILNPNVSPWIETIPNDSSRVKVFFFKPGYQDTAITVKLRQASANFLFVHLSPELDSAALDAQNDFLRSRTRRIWAKKAMWSSLAPLLLSGFFAAQSAYYYDKAQISPPTKGFPDLEKYQKDYNHYRQNVRDGDAAKTHALISLGIAGTIFVMGALFSF